MFTRMINSLEETIIVLLLATMTLLVFVEVVLRFWFDIGLMWSQELTLLLSAWMVLFGASYGIKVGSHIGVDALVKILPPTARKIVSTAAVLACLFYTALFSFGAWVYLSKMHSIGIELEDLPIQKWVAHSILLIGMLLIAFRLLALLWRIFTGEAEGFQLADEAKDSMHLAEETKAASQGGNSE
ncbi:TRAP transporter small permease [Geopsychrobacter electrodiphilus]|uniref:TRAP transporter small permease n=1 Tax=Geopsychrobacter electrodiphilus TaxID=225196 RepID=UPI000374994F|nr:TRAP transporter small permease [Geopsychrobacter electrodiphilus]